MWHFGCNAHHLYDPFIEISGNLALTITSAAALESSLTSKITAWAPLSSAMRACKSQHSRDSIQQQTLHATMSKKRDVNVVKASNSSSQVKLQSDRLTRQKCTSHCLKPSQGGSHALSFRPQNPPFSSPPATVEKYWIQTLDWLDYRGEVGAVNIQTEIRKQKTINQINGKAF